MKVYNILPRSFLVSLLSALLAIFLLVKVSSPLTATVARPSWSLALLLVLVLSMLLVTRYGITKSHIRKLANRDACLIATIAVAVIVYSLGASYLPSRDATLWLAMVLYGVVLVGFRLYARELLVHRRAVRALAAPGFVLIAASVVMAYVLHSTNLGDISSEPRRLVPLILLSCIMLISVSSILSTMLVPTLGSRRTFVYTLLLCLLSIVALYGIGGILFYHGGTMAATTGALASLEARITLLESNRLGEAHMQDTRNDHGDPFSLLEEQRKNMFGLFSLLIGLAALGITIWGLWVQSKLDNLTRLDEQVEELNGLAIVAAEAAFTSLPDFSRSQQVPDKSMPNLAALEQNVFLNNQRQLSLYLQRIGNGLKLQYARAILHFGRGEFPGCEHILLSAVIAAGASGRLWADAIYRLGITYRQQEDWSGAMSAFAQLARSASARSQKLGYLGIIITLLGWKPRRSTPDWVNNYKGSEGWRGRVIDLTPQAQPLTIETDFDYLAVGWPLAKELHKRAPDSTMARAYYLKYIQKILALSSRTPENLGTSVDELLRDVRELRTSVSTRADEADNIAINYACVEALCYLMECYFLRFHKLGGLGSDALTLGRKKFERVVTLAQQYGHEAAESEYSDLIYSEFEEREVPPQLIAIEATAILERLEEWMSRKMPYDRLCKARARV